MIGKGWLKPVVIAAWGLFAGGMAAAWASGFSATDPGVKAMGLAGALAARAEDPTAGFYNPGALALVKKGKLTVGLAGLFQNESHYQGLPPGIGAGTASQQDRFLQVPASAFAALPLGTKVKLGVGLYTPFALRTGWADPDNFAGRFLTTRSQLQTYDVNGNLAWQAAPWFGLGAGVVYRSSKLSMGRRLSAFEPGLGIRDVGSFAIASGWNTGVGWDAGFLLKGGERLALGGSYRSTITVNYGGAGRLTQITTGNDALDALNRASLPYGIDLPVQSSVAFPATATVGLGFAPIAGLWVETDVTQTAWSRFKGLNVIFTSQPSFSRAVQGPWEDALSYRVGIELEVAGGIKLRGGYALEKSPQPDASLAPFFPDAQRSVISAGFGRDWLDLGFQFISPASRTTRVNADSLNGTYTGNTYVLGISITKK